MASILALERQGNSRIAFRDSLEQKGHEVSAAGSLEATEQLVLRNEFDVIVTNIISYGLKEMDLSIFMTKKRLAKTSRLTPTKTGV